MYSVTCPCLWRMLCSGCSLFSFDSCSWSLSAAWALWRAITYFVLLVGISRLAFQRVQIFATGVWYFFFVFTSYRVYVSKNEMYYDVIVTYHVKREIWKQKFVTFSDCGERVSYERYPTGCLFIFVCTSRVCVIEVLVFMSWTQDVEWQYRIN